MRISLIWSWPAVAAALALTLLSARAQTPPSTVPSTLVVGSFGGHLDEIYRKVFVPFEKKFNVTIRWVPSSSNENLAKVAATRNQPEFDNVLIENVGLAAGHAQGLFEPVDPSIVTHYVDVIAPARLVGDAGVGFGLLYQGLFYRPDVFAQKKWAPPESWSDLFRPEVCSQLGFLDPNVTDGMRVLMALAGGDVARVPDVIARLATLKDCLTTLEPSSPKMEEKLQLGEYSLGVINSIRAIPIVKRGFPIKFVLPKEGTVAAYSVAAAVKGAPHARMAQEFLNWFLAPEVQAQLMSELFYSPVNRKVRVPEDLRALGVLDQDGMQKLIPVSDEAVVAQRQNWVRQVRRAMSR